MSANLTIKLNAASAATLRASILEKTEPSAKPAAEARLDAILADERIDPIEAPRLFQALKQSTPLTSVDTPSLLTPDEKHNALVQDLIHNCATVMDHYIQMVQSLSNEYHEEEKSFLNYGSIENCFGLSYTLFGRTGSSYRMEATDKVLSDIQDMRLGLEILQISLLQGRLPEDNAFVRKFMSGPFGTLINIRHTLSIEETGMPPTPVELHYQTLQFARGLVSLSERYEATELAMQSAFFMSDHLPDDEIRKLLPDISTCMYEKVGRRITNSVFNIPSVALMALTGPGRLLAEIPKVRAAVQTTMAAMGPARYILPGVSYYRMGGEAVYSTRVTHLLSNILFELLKGSAYAGAGRKVGGNIGATIGLMGYMGGAWLRVGYTQQLTTIMANEVMAGETTGIVGNWIQRGMSYSDQMFLADDIAQVQFIKSFRLTPLGNSSVNYSGISAIRGQLQTDAEMVALRAREAEAAALKAAEAAKLLATAMKRLDSPMAYANRVASTLSEGKGDELLAAIQKIKDSITLPNMVTDAKKAIEALTNIARDSAKDAKKLAEAAQRANTQAPITRRMPIAPQRLVSEAKDPMRSRPTRIAEYEDEAARQTPPEGTTVPTQPKLSEAARASTPSNGSPALGAVEELIKNPPRVLTQDTLDIVTRGRISFSEDAIEELTTTYQTVPELRGAILRRLNELSTLNGKPLSGWKKLQLSSDYCVNGRVGLYHRILAKRLENGQWKVYKFADRGDLDTESWY